MKCHLVLDVQSRGWIIEKICNRLAAELQALHCDVSIGETADEKADVNHFMLFWWMPASVPGNSTVGITHVDDSHRLVLARNAIAKCALGICMSSMTVRQLVGEGLPENKLCFIPPALDAGIEPRRIVIGITTKVYPDGRKREGLLRRLAADIDLSAFHFEIFGSGWDDIAQSLRHAGATVSVTAIEGGPDEEYRQLRQRISSFDYYLYTGLDEGSMGTLDALAAGVRTIITPQGFHVDLPYGITHPFWEYAELRAIFQDIALERDRRIRSVQALTWKSYAGRHLQAWRVLLEEQARENLGARIQERLQLGIAEPSHDARLERERRYFAVRTLRRYHVPRWRSAVGRWLRRVLPRAIQQRVFRN